MSTHTRSKPRQQILLKSKSKQQRNGNNQVSASSLQGVILADNYGYDRFSPLTNECPKILLPLAGCPLIHYTIDLLVNSNIKQIIIICSSENNQQLIEQEMNNSQWMKSQYSSQVQIEILTLADCHNIGQVLRFLHTNEKIHSNPFVLCRGDCVTNSSLTKIIRRHKKRYQKHKGTLMTSIFNKVHAQQRSIGLDDDLFLTLRGSEIINYSNDRTSTQLNFSLESLLAATKTKAKTGTAHNIRQLEVHHNLLDTGIDICSLQVLSEFSDNFDWKSIRGQFFNSIIGSDIYTYKIYSHLLKDNEYAARVKCWKSYHAISLDILERWTHPLTLDSNTVSHNYYYEKTNVYKEDNVRIGLDAQIGPNCVLCINSSVGQSTHISRSVIGPFCKIGVNVQIRNSYLFGHVIIGDNCKLDGCVIANNVHVEADAQLNHGCILSYNTRISAGVHLSPFTKITNQNQSQNQSQSMSTSTDFNLLAINGGDSSRSNSSSSTSLTITTPRISENSSAFAIVGETGLGFEWKSDLRKDIQFPDYLPDECNSILSTFEHQIERGIPFRNVVDLPLAASYGNDTDLINDSDASDEDANGVMTEHRTKNIQIIERMLSTRHLDLDIQQFGNNGDNNNNNDNNNTNLASIDSSGNNINSDVILLPDMTRNSSTSSVSSLASNSAEDNRKLNTLILEISDSIARGEIFLNNSNSNSNSNSNNNTSTNDSDSDNNDNDNDDNDNKPNIENYVFEITTGIRLGNQANLLQFSTAVFICLFTLIPPETSVANTNALQEVIEETFERWCVIFEGFSNDTNNEVIILHALQTASFMIGAQAGSLSGQTMLFLYAFRSLYYDCDLIDLESIQKWMEQRLITPNGTLEKLLATTVQQMMDEEDEEDSDDEDDDESEEEESQ